MGYGQRDYVRVYYNGWYVLLMLLYSDLECWCLKLKEITTSITVQHFFLYCEIQVDVK